MSDRREFTKADKVSMTKRATRNGVVYCEGCGLPTKRWQYDHKIAEAYVVDKRRKLTTDDGQLLCSGTPESCHDRKTMKEDIPGIARAKRREAAHLGAHPAPTRKIESAPLPISERTAAKMARGPKASLPPRQLYR